MCSAPIDRDTDLLMMLHVASHVLETELTARLAIMGITPRENCVLTHALNCGLTQTELAEVCKLDKTTMVVTIDTLEKRGLAERRPSPFDRRARIITVTEAGEDVVAASRQVVKDIYANVLSVLDTAERDAFLKALVKLVEGRLSIPVPCEKPPRRRALRVRQLAQ